MTSGWLETQAAELTDALPACGDDVGARESDDRAQAPNGCSSKRVVTAGQTGAREVPPPVEADAGRRFRDARPDAAVSLMAYVRHLPEGHRTSRRGRGPPSGMSTCRRGCGGLAQPSGRAAHAWSCRTWAKENVVGSARARVELM